MKTINIFRYVIPPPQPPLPGFWFGFSMLLLLLLLLLCLTDFSEKYYYGIVSFSAQYKRGLSIVAWQNVVSDHE